MVSAGKPTKVFEEDLKTLSESERIEIAKRFYGAANDVEARFMLAIMDGSINGDVREVRDDADR